MQIIRQASRAILVMGMAFTILWGVANPMTAFAEVRQVDVTGAYLLSSEEMTDFTVAKNRAQEQALRMAIDQASVLVESYSESHNMELTKDEIQTIAGAVLRVEQTEFSYDEVSENCIKVLCHILGSADTDSIPTAMLRER